MTSKMFSLIVNHVGEKHGEIKNYEQFFSLFFIYKNSHNIGVHEIMNY